MMGEFIQKTAGKSEQFMTQIEKEGGLPGLIMNAVQVSAVTKGIPASSIPEAILLEEKGILRGALDPKKKEEHYKLQSTLNHHLIDLGVTTAEESHAFGVDSEGRLSRHFLAKFLMKGMKKDRSSLGQLKRLFKGRLNHFQRTHTRMEEMLGLLKGAHRDQIVAHCQKIVYYHGSRN